MSMARLHIWPGLKGKYWSFLKLAAVLIAVLPMPAYGHNNDTLFQFSMQAGSVLYITVIVSLLIREVRTRLILFAIYLSLTAVAYSLATDPSFGLSLLATIYIHSFFPLLTTIAIALLLKARTNLLQKKLAE